MQIVSKVCMKCQIFFSGKNKKKIFQICKMQSAENFAQSAKR